MVILANTKLRDAFREHPELKTLLVGMSPKFEKLNNPLVFRLVERWVTFGDIAKVGGLSICEILHRLNSAIGMEKELFKLAPECIKEREITEERKKRPNWLEDAKETVLLDVREREGFFLNEILSVLKTLRFDQVLLVINSFYPAPLVKMMEEAGNETFYESPRPGEHRLYIKKGARVGDWRKRREDFEVLDVRGWREDPFSEILKKANEIAPGEGFRLVQFFYPEPLVNMIEPMGFETEVERRGEHEFHIYFYKKEDVRREKLSKSGRIPLVIQSATPVVYPVIMKLLQSKELMNRIRIEELKVWDKTEKHLGWIVNGKADISFSAVAAVANLFQKGLDIKMTAIIVWDNFYLLTNGFKAEDFSDLGDKSVFLPLIRSAPPFAVTTYLIKALGYDPADFDFRFGEPFGRPTDIKDMLVSGRIEAGLLREPEASFAIYEGKGRVVESIAYKDLWKKLFPGEGNLPNAGLLFKGEILREHPDVARLFMEETKKAIDWVVSNRREAARLSYDIMGVSPEEAELFLSRVNFDYKPSREVLDSITNYIEVLNKAGYGRKRFDELENLFA